MRPLPQNVAKDFERTQLAFLALLAACAWTLGCGGGGAVATPPPPPPSITVSVTPTSGSVVLGNQVTFAATVSNATVSSVTWSVNSIAGGNSTVGTISSTGVYTAPADLPSPATVQITATSHADPTKSAAANLTVTSDITLSLTPNPANVELGATQAFRAAVTSSGHPDNAVRWSLSGAACPSACGTLDSSGTFTAPAILPSSANVTITAQSAADPSKQVSAAMTITSNFALQLSAPSNVPAGASTTLVATFTPLPNSNPSTVLSWSLSGAGCSGSSCGVVSVTTTQSTGGSSIADSATYTAPSTAPSPNTVAITVTPQADPSKKAQATIAIQPGVSINVSPVTATVAANHRVTLAVQLNGTSNAAVNWNVNGIAGGNAILGQICVVGSNPCQIVTGTATSSVDYVAPGSIPSPNPVSVTAASAADATKSASAQITVINHVLVSVQPANVTLAPLGVQGFQVTVLGTTNQNVTWQVQGTACSAAGACGTINASGIFMAPASPPSPNAIQVVAISADDTTQLGAATVTISGGPNILTLHPSSVYAGAAQGFTLRTDGSGFAASSSGPGSTLVIAGTARTTTCISAQECAAPVTATDVALTGNLSVQVQNPNGASSAPVLLIIATPNLSDEVIALTSSLPAATGKDVVVVVPTTAGISSPGNDLDLNVGALGIFSTATNSCALGGNPIPLQRPASGTAAADICLFSQSGFDTSMTYTVSGPGDIAVISKQPAGLGIIHLTLQIPASAAPGARTLFIQTTNLDKTAATAHWRSDEMSYVERRRFLWILFLIALTLLVIAANATTLARMRFEELAQQATAVARLRCLTTKSFWQNGEIWTDTQFQVVEQAKGALPETSIVRTLGGTLGNLHSRVEEAPVFHPGEEAFLFLWGRQGEPLRVLGWSQGTFRIARDPRTGTETVTQDSAAAPLFDPQSRRFVHEGIRNLPIAIFQMKLKKALQGDPPR